MNAYARGCAAAQVDNLREEYGGAPRFKVGDRVRVVRLGHEVEGSCHEAKIGEVLTVTDVFDDEVHTNDWYFFPYEIEPVEDKNDNTPAPTAGFTVPLCAYEPVVTTTALGDAYVAGYKAGLAAATAQAAA